MTEQDRDLKKMTCEACHTGAPKLTAAEIADLMPQIPEWKTVTFNDVPRLRRIFEFDGWLPAVEFVNKVAEIAEENDHHPQIRLEWGKVQVNWWTHKIKGLHQNDFIMAAKTDGLWRDLQ